MKHEARGLTVMGMKAILAGGSGFLGELLARDLVSRRWEVVVLTRHPQRTEGPVRDVAWDGKTSGPWTAELDGAEALVNLTGRSVNCVHTAENQRLILESRVDSVRVLGEAVARCAHPPPVWVQSGSLAIYGNPGDRICDENAPHADDFSARVCEAWEAAFAQARVPGVRQVLFRIGLVLGAGGGALAPLAKLTRWFLGGRVGHGRQYLSWLHADDMNAVFWAAISRADLTGTFNACSPNPVTNAEFMRTLRYVLDRPSWTPPAPEWAVRFGAKYLMRTDPDLALTGRRCVPARLLAQGVTFRFPELGKALEDACHR